MSRFSTPARRSNDTARRSIRPDSCVYFAGGVCTGDRFSVVRGQNRLRHLTNGSGAADALGRDTVHPAEDAVVRAPFDKLYCPWDRVYVARAKEMETGSESTGSESTESESLSDSRSQSRSDSSRTQSPQPTTHAVYSAKAVYRFTDSRQLPVHSVLSQQRQDSEPPLKKQRSSHCPQNPAPVRNSPIPSPSDSRPDNDSSDNGDDDETALVADFDVSLSLYFCEFIYCEFETDTKQEYRLHLLAKHMAELAQLGYPVNYTKAVNERYIDIPDLTIWGLHVHFPLEWHLPKQPYRCTKLVRGRPCARLFFTKESLAKHRVCSAQRRVLRCPVLGCWWVEQRYGEFVEHVHMHRDEKCLFPKQDSAFVSDASFDASREFSRILDERVEVGKNGRREDRNGEGQEKDISGKDKMYDNAAACDGDRKSTKKETLSGNEEGEAKSKVAQDWDDSKITAPRSRDFLGLCSSTLHEVEPIDDLFSD